MRRALLGAAVLVTALATLGVRPAAAYDPDRVWAKGQIVGSLEAGYGSQFNLESKSAFTGIEFLEFGVRWSLLPLGPTGSGFFRGALETGVEPIVLTYTHPKDAYYVGLAAMGRYHFLSLGRFVPYVEAGAAAGGTNLKVVEIRSDFAFLLLGGVGASFFVTDNVALYAGYRWTHNSNGNTSQPNRGWEANTGILGASFFYH